MLPPGDFETPDHRTEKEPKDKTAILGGIVGEEERVLKIIPNAKTVACGDVSTAVSPDQAAASFRARVGQWSAPSVCGYTW